MIELNKTKYKIYELESEICRLEEMIDYFLENVNIHKNDLEVAEYKLNKIIEEIKILKRDVKLNEPDGN